MSRQKQKGNAFERVISDHLTAIFNLKFFRTPGSGAYVGGKNFHRVNELTNSQQLLLEGDIVVPEELDYLKFECKSFKKFSFSSLLESNSLIDSWIDQARSEHKLWFLVFKINNRGTFIVYEEDLYDIFEHSNSKRLIYDDVVIERIDGFFENNKSSLLKYGDRFRKDR
tara:strand:- start:3924 stop:4430 length:507 start_codon:yes stop_codon:yes gene_type:complete